MRINGLLCKVFCGECGEELRRGEASWYCDNCKLFWPTEQSEAHYDAIAKKLGLPGREDVFKLIKECCELEKLRIKYSSKLNEIRR